MINDSKLLILPTGSGKSQKSVTLSTGSSINSLIDLKVPHYGGSFEYVNREDSEEIRRRFLLWRVTDEYLTLEECSFDSNFVDNSIRFHFKNDVILAGVSVVASNDRIQILVPTVSVAQRICIPYQSSPDGVRSRLSQSDMEISFGLAADRSSGNHRSSSLGVLNTSDFSNPKNCYSLNFGTTSASPHTAASTLSSSDEALFAYGLTDGSILLVTMAAYDEDGAITQDIFAQTSTVRRLLTGFMSPFSRNESMAPTTPTSMAFHVSEDDVVLHATGFDQKVRSWSCRQKELISTMDVMPQNALRVPVVSYVDGDKWRIRAATNQGSPFVALYTCSEGVSQFSIHCFSGHGRQKSLVQVMEFEAPEADLLDFQLSEKALFTLWTQNGETILRWRDLNLSSLESWSFQAHWSSEIMTAEMQPLREHNTDDPQAILTAIFDSRVFGLDVVSKAVKMCSKNALPVSNALNWNRLKKEFDQYLDRLGDGGGSKMGGSAKTKFLRSVWSCCLQYDQESRRPLALLHCPTMNVHGIILAKQIAILTNVTLPLQELLVINDGISQALQSNVIDCFSKLDRHYLSAPHLGRDFDAKLFDDGQSTWALVQEQLVEAVYSQDSTDLQRALLASESGLNQTLTAILKYLDRSDKILTGATPIRRGGMAYEFQTAFRSDLGATFLSTAIDKALRERFNLAKKALLLIAACSHFKYKLKIPSSTWSFVDGKCIPRLLELLRFYAVLRWICVTPIANSEFNKNNTGNNSLLENLLLHPVSDKIRNYWTKFCSADDPDRRSNELDSLVQATIDALWSTNNFVTIFEYLIVTEQYERLLDLCEKIDPQCKELTFSRAFVQAYALLQLDDPKKALIRFRMAYEGVERGDPLLIRQLSLAAGTEEPMPISGLYFLKVAELYEKKGLSVFAIETCENFVRNADNVDAAFLPVLQLMFKHYLHLKLYDEAFETVKKMESNRAGQSACLRQFIFHMQEENLLGQLNEYDLGDLEHEFLSIIESRTRSIDLTVENSYEFLFAYFVTRSNYRKAASFMYEMAVRYRKEVGGKDALRRQVDAYAACLHTLALEKDGTWIERPQIDYRLEFAGASPKRASDGEEKETNTIGQSKHVGKKEIETEYILAKGNLALAERESMTGAILPPKELVKSLMQYNLFDLAVNISIVCELPLTEIMDCLALRCVQSEKSRSSTGMDNECWSWMNENRAICTVSTDSRSHNFAWSLLRAYLEHLSTIVPASPLYTAAARRLLSLSKPLPPWFVDHFKKIDFPELLRLLIEYDLLLEAQRLLCDYIDAASGIGSEDFKLTETLAKGKAQVWLPFSSIDLLLAILSENPSDVEYAQLRNEINGKLNHYFRQLDAKKTDELHSKMETNEMRKKKEAERKKEGKGKK